MTAWRASRLHEKADFKHIWSSAERQRYPARSCQFFWIESSHDHPRFAVIVSKKVSKRAVDRNYHKRIHRHAFHVLKEHLPNIDVIVVVRHKQSNVSRASYQDIYRHWEGLCNYLKEP